MKNTSLQKIISNYPPNLDQIQIQRLFGKHNYPHFQLQDLKTRPELLKKASYTSFLNMLENWNTKVDEPRRQINECQYHKNEFIFSWLKWVAVQNNKYVDSSLTRLQNWYNSSRNKQVGFLMREQNLMKSYAQDWQIRNSYRSNLPLEIDNYKRRAIFNIKNVNNSLKASSQKENVPKQNKKLPQKYIKELKINEKENSRLREVREKREMENYLNSLKKSKMRFKTTVKDFYKTQFPRDKLENSTSSLKEKLNKSLFQKDYRLKTSTQSFRKHFRGQNSSLNKTVMTAFYNSTNNSFLKMDSNEADCNLPTNESKSLNTSNIDGIGLIVNPFDIKIIKKKRS